MASSAKDRAVRTLAYQEVILRIGPLAKLGRFESKAEIFLSTLF